MLPEAIQPPKQKPIDYRLVYMFFTSCNIYTIKRQTLHKMYGIKPPSPGVFARWRYRQKI